MYAIVDIAGQQFKVTKDIKLYVHRLEAEEGAIVEFNNVLLVDNDGKVAVGKPSVDGYRVAARVLSHLKGDKVLVFKKKRRKGYQTLNGHRQQFSKILIKGILTKGETLKVDADEKPIIKKTVTHEAAPKAEKKVTAKAATKKTTDAPKAEAKKAPAKKAAESKTTKKK